MSDFYDLARAAETDPGTCDMAALRRAYVGSGAYNPAKHIMQAKLMQITNIAGGFADVAQTCRSILDANPLDLEARRILALAQEKLGEREAAEKNNLFTERMIDAILAEGNGKSFETAWKVVAEAEIWTLFKVFGMKPESNTRHRREDAIFDVFEGRIEKDAVTMFFDVTAPIEFLNRMLNEGPE